MPRPLAVLKRAALLISIIAIAPQAMAQESGNSWQGRTVLGHGSLFTNDVLADLRDRWRSGSYVYSRITGPAGPAPDLSHGLPGFGQIRELRFRSEIIQPANVSSPAPNDRRYAGIASVGMHTHFGIGGAQASLGADLVAVGPMTMVGDVQKAFHGILGLPDPTVAVANQFGNALYPTVLGEMALPVPITQNLSLRPFAEGQVGAETFVRGGLDIVLGQVGVGGLMLRDVTTGQLYRGISGVKDRGVSFVVGGDIAHVTSSVYLPADGVARLKTVRGRARAGLHWYGEHADVFYGVTYLGPEFTQQLTGQTVGSVRLRIRF